MASDTGRQRSNNEDRVYLDEAGGVFIVVDGVGGHAAGEAAEIAAEVIPRQIESLTGPWKSAFAGPLPPPTTRSIESRRRTRSGADGLRADPCRRGR